MANPVTLEDVIARWRPLSFDESVNAEAFLADAWALATLKIPELDARVTAETIDLSLVRMVICAAVLRVLKNPDGKQTEQLEDYRYTMAEGAASGTLFLTDEELLVLRPASPSPSGAFTIRPYGQPDPL